MAAAPFSPPIVVLEVNRKKFVYHMWKDALLSESTETSDQPTGQSNSFQIQSRELPQSVKVEIECSDDMVVPTSAGPATYQNVSKEEQIATLRGFRNQTATITTRTFSFKALVKSVDTADSGVWTSGGIVVTLTLQVVVLDTGGLRLDADGNILLPDIRRVRLAVNKDPDKAESGSGEESKNITPPVVTPPHSELVLQKKDKECIVEHQYGPGVKVRVKEAC